MDDLMRRRGRRPAAVDGGRLPRGRIDEVDYG
jgi:hypothetical protein